VFSQFVDNLSYLLQFKGSDINAKTKEGLTALHLAVQKQVPDIIKVLIAAGASPKIKSSKNQTALELAQSLNHAEVLKALIN